MHGSIDHKTNGEAIDIVKKWMAHGHELDKDHLAKELGDIAWYLAEAATALDVPLEDILQEAADRGENALIVICDELTDPHNLGAILRTAECAGAHGVIIPKRRSVGLNATVGKTSAGAIEYMPVARVTNIVKTMEMLKKEGLWFACADMNGEVMYRCNLKGPIGLVIGNEGDGVSRLVREKCDMVATIPMKGDIDSLNASVAAGVLAFEVVRQRMSVK